MDVRWFLRSSLRSSAGLTHLPRSSTTTLRPATASSLATTPPPAPAPITTASTFRIGRPPSAHRQWRDPEHGPAREVVIAAVPWISVKPLHRVRYDEVEERAAPLVLLDRAEGRLLLLRRSVGERAQ